MSNQEYTLNCEWCGDVYKTSLRSWEGFVCLACRAKPDVYLEAQLAKVYPDKK